jgi:hypothetical protein
MALLRAARDGVISSVREAPGIQRRSSRRFQAGAAVEARRWPARHEPVPAPGSERPVLDEFGNRAGSVQQARPRSGRPSAARRGRRAERGRRGGCWDAKRKMSAGAHGPKSPSVRIARLGNRIITSRRLGPTDRYGFCLYPLQANSPMGRYRRTYRQSACAFETTEPSVPATAPDPLGELVGTDMSGFAFTHCRRKAQWVATTEVWCPPRAGRVDIEVYADTRPQATKAIAAVSAGPLEASASSSLSRLHAEEEGANLSRIGSNHAQMRQNWVKSARF